MANEQNTIELQVVTPERHILSEDVDSVEMPGKDGYLGILPGHAPLLTEMGIGILTYRKGGETRSTTIMGGYAEVLPNRVIVLADAAELTDKIDTARAQAALDKTKSNLPGANATEADWEAANAAIARATVRLEAASKGGSGATATAAPELEHAKA
ncbi:MAG TPA: F0F1 ATP synthase subunit epsilon [Candidatus Acidoferrales bacterium]